MGVIVTGNQTSLTKMYTSFQKAMPLRMSPVVGNEMPGSLLVQKKF